MSRTRSSKNKRKWPKILLITAGVLLLGIGFYVYSVYRSLNETLETIHEPIRETSEKREEKVTLDRQDPFSVLLLGVDQRPNDRGRSDTMIVLTVNPNKESVQMVSIPRDTRTEIVGKGIQDKINHAYAFGGVEMAIDTVENFLDIPIDYYVQINMEGFKDIVDAVGGVTVENDMEFSHGGHHFPKGNITLNGEEALSFVRMRKGDPRGEFGRQFRQRQIIEAVIKEGASLNTLMNYGDIFEAVAGSVKTNLTFDEMVAIQKQYRKAAKNINQHQIDGSGRYIDGIFYWIVPEEEQTALQDLLKEHLEI